MRRRLRPQNAGSALPGAGSRRDSRRTAVRQRQRSEGRHAPPPWLSPQRFPEKEAATVRNSRRRPALAHQRVDPRRHVAADGGTPACATGGSGPERQRPSRSVESRSSETASGPRRDRAHRRSPFPQCRQRQPDGDREIDPSHVPVEVLDLGVPGSHSRRQEHVVDPLVSASHWFAASLRFRGGFPRRLPRPRGASARLFFLTPEAIALRNGGVQSRATGTHSPVATLGLG